MEVMMIPSHEAQSAAGPQRNIFHPLAWLHFRDWPEAPETLLSSYVWYGGSIG